ncbi:MAG: hypothetical protein WCF18_20710, partial [Chthoniobacteraceae bacterium]
DGDAVTITTSKGTNADLAAIVTVEDTGLGKELQRVDFSLNAPVFAGTNLTVTAKPTTAGGDGLVNVGFIDATAANGGTALDLGTVSIRGDLGRVEAGDASTGTTAVKSLSVQSMGEFGTSTQQAGSTLTSIINGALGSLKVVGNMRDAFVVTIGGLDGKVGSVTIGGSIIAGGLSITGPMGLVKIGGNLEGGGDPVTGLIVALDTLAGVTVGGSLLGGSGSSEAGEISSVGAMGPVKIGGNIVGGEGGRSGRVTSEATIASITVGGSLLGGLGNRSGQIEVVGAIGSIKIGGNIEGGVHTDSSGLQGIGYIQAGRIGSLFVGGSITAGKNFGPSTLIDSGAVRVFDDLGTVVVKGSLIGNSTNPVLITARGQATPGATADVAIKGLTVGGRVEFTDILAGYIIGGTPIGVNADAQIGAVAVGGDWIASNLVAGVQDDGDPMRDASFGDGNDQKITGGTNNLARTSKIASITIKGTARGTIGGTDHFGFVAQEIGSFKIGTTAFPLVAGPASVIDITGYALGITGDLRAREVAIL